MKNSHAEHHLDCIRDAQALFSRSDVIVLDTETTGFGPRAEIVDIAIVNIQQKTLLNTLVKPQDSIPADVTRIHGITNAMVQHAPHLDELFPLIAELLSNNLVLIYNAGFDTQMLRYSANRYHLTFPPYNVKCLMLMYAAFRGEIGNHGSYRWHKLENACTHHGIKPGGHRALSDVTASIELLRVMADHQL